MLIAASIVLSSTCWESTNMKKCTLGWRGSCTSRQYKLLFPVIIKIEKNWTSQLMEWAKQIGMQVPSNKVLCYINGTSCFSNGISYIFFFKFTKKCVTEFYSYFRWFWKLSSLQLNSNWRKWSILHVPCLFTISVEYLAP